MSHHKETLAGFFVDMEEGWGTSALFFLTGLLVLRLWFRLRGR